MTDEVKEKLESLEIKPEDAVVVIKPDGGFKASLWGPEGKPDDDTPVPFHTMLGGLTLMLLSKCVDDEDYYNERLDEFKAGKKVTPDE